MEILKMIDNKDSKAMISKFLNCRVELLDKFLKRIGVEYNGNRGMKGKRISSTRKSAEEYLKQEKISIHKLRIKLIEDGIKKNECENCNLNKWCGNQIPLELHHVDGNKLNNSLTNLQILCPNCHALTSNHAGKKNKKNPEDKAIYKRTKLCECGELIKKTSKQCLKCYHDNLRKLKNVNIEELNSDVKLIGYLATGRKYGVSDTTIKKYLNKK